MVVLLCRCADPCGAPGGLSEDRCALSGGSAVATMTAAVIPLFRLSIAPSPYVWCAMRCVDRRFFLPLYALNERVSRRISSLCFCCYIVLRQRIGRLALPFRIIIVQRMACVRCYVNKELGNCWKVCVWLYRLTRANAQSCFV